MKKFFKIIKFLTGILLIVAGLLFFLYPNFREWRTQQEVNTIIDSFEESREESSNPGDYSGNGADGIEAKANAQISDTMGTKGKTKKDTNNQVQGETPVTDYSQFPELYQAMVYYNRELISNGQSISDAWNYEQIPLDFPDIDADNPVIGYINIPDMDIRLPLYLGASSDNLKKGAAVLSGTSMPIGGMDTNCVIAAHRGWNGSAYFQYIEDLVPGSKVYITTPWETLVYEVRQEDWNKIIYPDDVDAIRIQKGKDMITLFTCHPYQLGGGPYRYLVFCDRVNTQKATTKDEEIIDMEAANVTPTTLPAETVDPEDRLTTSPTPETAVNIDGTEFVSDGQVDMLVVERILRVALPTVVIVFTAIIILARIFRNKKNKKIKITPSSGKGKSREKAGANLLDNKKNKKKEGGR